MMPKSKKSEKSTCDLCSDSLTKGQDILNCEGDCNCTVHRYCAGVTSSQFQTLSTSSTPFVCQWCMLKTTNAVIKQLQSEVASLKCDLVSVRAEVSKKDEENAALVSSLKSELATVNDRISRNQETVETVAPSYASAVFTKPKSTNLRTRPRNNRTSIAAANRTPTTAINREGQEQNLKGGKSKTKPKLVKVSGARKVWGTLKACSQATILSTISKLLPTVSKLNLTIKRKTRELGPKSIWWFVIRGSESDLIVLENEWERVKFQTSWLLEPCVMPDTTPPQEASSAVTPNSLTASPVDPTISRTVLTTTSSQSPMPSTNNCVAPPLINSEPVQEDALPGDGDTLLGKPPQIQQTH